MRVIGSQQAKYHSQMDSGWFRFDLVPYLLLHKAGMTYCKHRNMTVEYIIQSPDYNFLLQSTRIHNKGVTFVMTPHRLS